MFTFLEIVYKTVLSISPIALFSYIFFPNHYRIRYQQNCSSVTYYMYLKITTKYYGSQMKRVFPIQKYGRMLAYIHGNIRGTFGRFIEQIMSIYVNKMKNKKYHTTGTIPKSNI
jgi:hypothetical protein